MKKISFYMNVAASAMLAFTLSASMQSCGEIDNPVDPTEEPTDPETPGEENGEEEEAGPAATADEFLAAIEAAEDGDTIEVAAGAEIILNDQVDLTDKSIVILTDEDKPAILAPSSRGFLTNTSVSFQNFIIEAADIVEKHGLVTLEVAEDVTTIDSVAFINVNIKNLHSALIAGAKNNVVGKVIVENSVVAIKGAQDYRLFDFRTKGLPELVSVNNSTIWADETTVATNGNFYSTQGGQTLSELNIESNVISITNSTLYNIAKGRPVCTLRQKGVDGQQYVVKNSVIVNCGANGQFYRGLNERQAGKAANWDIDGNVVNFNGEVSEEAITGKDEDYINNAIEKVVKFADAENGDFSQSEVEAGDPRWIPAAE